MLQAWLEAVDTSVPTQRVALPSAVARWEEALVGEDSIQTLELGAMPGLFKFRAGTRRHTPTNFQPEPAIACVLWIAQQFRERPTVIISSLLQEGQHIAHIHLPFVAAV